MLDSLPDWLQKMDETSGDVSMSGSSSLPVPLRIALILVSKPNKNIPVLIYCRRDCGEIVLDKLVPFRLATPHLADISDERADLAKGSTHLVKYSLVERWIDLGWAEVL